VSRWERGANRPVDDTLAALADALGLDWADFYAGPEREAA
jgi:transcriptional regulator with XRE-family HTH domain